MSKKDKSIQEIPETPYQGWKVLFIVSAYGFLLYKLASFDQYPALINEWKNMPSANFWWIQLVLILLPLNWWLEALKWKIMTAPVQKLTIKRSIYAVLAGISTGFFTPNRIGELVGRVLFLDADNRKAGVTLSLLNSVTQNIVMILCGIPALLLYIGYTSGKMDPNMMYYLLFLMLCIVASVLIYLFLPAITNRFKQNRYLVRITDYTDCLTSLSWRELIQITSISLLRYLVFSIQFYLMLRFFNIGISVWEAMIAIPTCYLFVTVTPTYSFSEAAVRSSYAVLVIGAFSGQEISIAIAGICIWLVNFVIPMLAGSLLVMAKR